ncbi:MAG: glycoside hydrolase family 65 protein [Kiritimatiellae bacterium]|nr:glycoside hydrolase family 65 protein [Kiritimatiellia bacterium]
MNTTREWLFEIDRFRPEDIELNGNRFMLGNGYLGIRGTLEEHGKDQLAGCMLNGVYDQVPGKWREPVNAPHPWYAETVGAGTILTHRQELDLRHGRMKRQTDYEHAQVIAERFASLADVHLVCLRYQATPKQGATVTVRTFIDPEVWEINGPHYKSLERGTTGDLAYVVGVTGELGLTVAVCESVLWQGQLGFTKVASLFTSLDVEDPLSAAIAHCRQARTAGWDQLSAAHDAAWDAVWNTCDVCVEGDAEAQFSLRYSLYQLQLAAPRHSDRVSIPARALSGQVYKGTVFWDTEMFMTPVFTLTDPAVARNLIRYRYHTLAGAREKASEYGYRGAYFAWESQERGNDACTHFNVTDVFTERPMRTYFRDKQIHISADVVYAIWKYYELTGDFSILPDGGAEVVAECARFFYSYAYYKHDKQRYELVDVTGPDEYHERVGNNAYTNRMVTFTLQTALRVLALLRADDPAAYEALDQKIEFSPELAAWRDIAESLWNPEPDPETGVIPQFDGYHKLEDCSLMELKSRMLNPNEYLGGGNGLATTTQILKQADVVLMCNLFRDDFAREIIARNWEFYEPRTEHGSSLSACAYAMVAAHINKPDWAYDYFMKTATVDLTGKSKQYVGTLYIGGTHPAANGGAWLVAAMGFCGIQSRPDALVIEPHLPPQWTGLSLPIVYLGWRLRITVRKDECRVEVGDTHGQPGARLILGGRAQTLVPGSSFSAV